MDQKEKTMTCPVCNTNEYYFGIDSTADGSAENVVTCLFCGTTRTTDSMLTEIIKNGKEKSFVKAFSMFTEDEDLHLAA
jgi:transcription elongation factor Elf1